MSNFDTRGQVALWTPKSDNPNAPNAKGTVVAHRDIKEGEELDIALWKNASDNPNAPKMKGKISDSYKAQQGQQQAPKKPASDPDFDDDLDSDLPF